MRRAVSVSLVISGLFIGVTGLWNFFPPFNSEFSVGHAVGGCVFGVLSVIHVWLNWKSILKYFKNLGWWWIPLALGLIAIIMIVIIPLIRM